MTSLSEALTALAIPHAERLPLPGIESYLIEREVALEAIVELTAAALDEAPEAQRAPLIIGVPRDLPAIKRALPEEAPLRPILSDRLASPRLDLLSALLQAQRLEVADVVEGIELPEAPGDLPRFIPSARLKERLATLQIMRRHKRPLPGYDQPHCVLARSPDAEAATILAQLRFGGYNLCPDAEEHIAILRYWRSIWGAELIACRPHRLDLVVTRRPHSWREAFELAQEHLDYCPPLAHGRPHAIKARASELKSSSLWTFVWSQPGAL